MICCCCYLPVIFLGGGIVALATNVCIPCFLLNTVVCHVGRRLMMMYLFESTRGGGVYSFIYGWAQKNTVG
jgi:hypothetical protein